MRLLHITIPAGSRDEVITILKDHVFPYTIADESSGQEIDGVATSPVPPEDVEAVLEELRAIGIMDEHNVIVLDVNTIVDSEPEEIVEEADEEEEEEDVTTRISREELHTRAEDLLSSRAIYATMTAVSAIIATAGILMDSAAVVVGSMVLAPLIGPSLAASVGTVLDDEPLSQTGVKLQVLGVILAIAAASAFAILVKQINLVPPDLMITEIGQVDERLSPDFLSLAIALGAGVAGALSLATGISAALVGVMIAVALIPPAAVIGIGIAWGLPTVVMGSTVLLVLNIFAINLAALGVLWYMGFRPDSWFKISKARSQTLKRVSTLAVAIVVISLFLGVVTVASYDAAIQDEEIHDGIDATLSAPAHEQLEVIDVSIERDNRLFFAQPETVVITLSRPVGTDPPSIASEISASIQDHLDRTVSVEINHVIRERSG